MQPHNFNAYTYDDAINIINQYRTTLVGTNVYRTTTPSGAKAEGLINSFLVIPYNVEQQGYESYLTIYQSLLLPDVWLKEKTKENLRWIPLVMIGDQYTPLVPFLVKCGVWKDN